MSEKLMKYDVAIIGGGVAGIFAAIELTNLAPSTRIVLLEQGNPIHKRSCPIVSKQTRQCVNCPTCAIMKGFGGAGAYSDGKFNFSTEYGGWLTDYLPPEKVMELIEYVDSINVKFGATEKTYSTSTPRAQEIEKIALQNDLHILHGSVKHLGTENNMVILRKQYEYLNELIDIKCNTAVSEIEATGKSFILKTHDGLTVECDYLISAPGRSGAEWFAGQCEKLNLKLINNQVDIGVRLEIPAVIFKHISDVVYEAKLVYRTKQYGDLVRTFCMNPNGYVVMENTDGIITVNGHSYADPKLKSENTNFALLVSNRFTKPFKEPYRYGKHISSLSNMLGGGVIVQRFGDLIRGTRTNEHRLSQSFVRPTLDATPGDLSLVLPKRHLDNIIEMIYALDKIAPGTANYDTLLYGVEVKFYSSRLELTGDLETEYTNMFAIGDGAGITRGLSQAGASGVHVARVIAGRINKYA